MDDVQETKYKKIAVNGPVSVEQVERVGARRQGNVSMKILIMGPTGAGKSTFIESLGLMGTERISSNRLEGFTQRVTTYTLNNASFSGGLMYLVDSPGFADTRISQISIVTMLKNWLRDNGQEYFHKILYVIPITAVRIPGSQRQVLETFEALTGVETSRNITIVTTMWDSLWGERAIKHAEEAFNQLRDDILKKFCQNGTKILKFRNTKNSSLSILDEAIGNDTGTKFHIENTNIPIHEAPFHKNLLADLKQRIENLQSEIVIHHLDLEHAEAQGDAQLQSIVQPKLEEGQKTLTRFQEELRAFVNSTAAVAQWTYIPAGQLTDSDDASDTESTEPESAQAESSLAPAGPRFAVPSATPPPASHLLPSNPLPVSNIPEIPPKSLTSPSVYHSDTCRNWSRGTIFSQNPSRTGCMG